MKKILVWFFAVVITLGAVVYQRVTGPTHPKRVKVRIENKEYKLNLIRSHGGTTDAPIELGIDKDVEATLYYRNYPVIKDENWTSVVFKKEGENYIAKLPNQPAAGKLMYYINIKTANSSIDVEKNSPIVIRFKGDVPAWILIPHILFMFLAMFFSNLSGILAATKMDYYLRYTYITFALLAIGGMVLGPIVQYYAFGELWTGVPYGWDLTDNKTLIAFVFYIIAVLGQLKKDRAYLIVIAAVVMLIVFSIPHSAFGSELDRNTGNITQGFIQIIGL
jgi:hypothetical protein